MSEGVWGRPESPHNQPVTHQSIKNNVVYYISCLMNQHILPKQLYTNSVIL